MSVNQYIRRPASLPLALFLVFGNTAGTATATGLAVVEVAIGNGEIAEADDIVTVHYTGWLVDGTKFDSSRDAGRPLVFQLGVGQVIGGWDQGVAGMRVGGKRTLTIPPELAYGDRGVPGLIPPGATLIFDVELVDVVKRP